VNYCRAATGDWDAVLALQEANLAWNLGDEERASGFLSARFSRDQFGAMNESGAVVVAWHQDALAGYVCASTPAFNAGVPIVAAMIQELSSLSFLGRSLRSPATVIYGPVCVSQSHRGQGVFRGLIEALKRELRGHFDTAAGFIARSNARSLAAHVDGLGMGIVGEFDFEGKRYCIVAFGVPPEAVACHV
jgi:GNAT superfamily N-acetyltransferase